MHEDFQVDITPREYSSHFLFVAFWRKGWEYNGQREKARGGNPGAGKRRDRVEGKEVMGYTVGCSKTTVLASKIAVHMSLEARVLRSTTVGL